MTLSYPIDQIPKPGMNGTEKRFQALQPPVGICFVEPVPMTALPWKELARLAAETTVPAAV